jgi:hypothetical protein
MRTRSPDRTRNRATVVNTPNLAESKTAKNTGFRVSTSVARFCIARTRGPSRTQNTGFFYLELVMVPVDRFGLSLQLLPEAALPFP